MSDDETNRPSAANQGSDIPRTGWTPTRRDSGRSTSTAWQPPPPELLQAEILAYKILALIGQGGMGAVYKGWQTSLERYVAIKVLPPQLEYDPDTQFAARFKQEARTMAKFTHPGIIGVYDAGETSTGLLFIAMEFIEGTDVAQMIKAEGRLQPAQALAVTAHVCDALDYAHTRGVIHRDIKPANIMVNSEGQVKVADFGLAKSNDPGAGHGLTKSNMAMGTPDFVAPEALIAGLPVDHRADLYAVGVMLYNMLTGEIPRGRFKPPSEKIGSDPRFDAIINKAMEQEREHRYQSAAEIRHDLDLILTTPAESTDASTANEMADRGESASPPRKPVMRGPGAPPQGIADTPFRKAQRPAPKSTGSSAALLVSLGILAVLGFVAFVAFKKANISEAPQSAAANTGSALDLGATGLPDAPEGIPGDAAAGHATFAAATKDAPSGVQQPLESGAIRLWDSAAKIPFDVPGAAWEGGALHLVNTAIKLGRPASRDLVLRVSVRCNPSLKLPAIRFRDQGPVTGDRDAYYKIVLSGTQGEVREVSFSYGMQTMPLKSWALPRSKPAGEWLAIEVRAEGPSFTISLDGERLDRVNDDTLGEPGGVSLFAGDAFFRDLVYVPLDAAADRARATTNNPK